MVSTRPRRSLSDLRPLTPLPAIACLLCGSSARAEIIVLPSCTQIWEPLGTGCAREISVGPNNVPWILGCPDGNSRASGPAWLYYLTYTGSGLVRAPQWVYDNFGDAIDVFVNMNGAPWVSGADG